MFHRWISTSPFSIASLRAGSASSSPRRSGEQRQHVEADRAFHGGTEPASGRRAGLGAGLRLGGLLGGLRGLLASISSHFFMYFLNSTSHVLRRLGADAHPVLDPAGLERDARRPCPRRAGRRCPAPRSPGRRAAGGRRWRRCGNSAGASGPSASCECELPRESLRIQRFAEKSMIGLALRGDYGSGRVFGEPRP